MPLGLWKRREKTCAHHWLLIVQSVSESFAIQRFSDNLSKAYVRLLKKCFLRKVFSRMRNGKHCNENSCCGLEWNVFMTSMDMTTKVRRLSQWPSFSLRSTMSSSLSRMSWPSCIRTSSARSSTCTGKYEWNEPLFILLLYSFDETNKTRGLDDDRQTSDVLH